jgi:hypothetical protein
MKISNTLISKWDPSLWFAVPKSETNFAVKHATAEDVLNLFASLDAKKNGIISIDEIVAAGKAGELDALLHRDTTHDVIRNDLSKFVKRHDDYVSIEEFFEWVRYREDQIAVAFKHLQAYTVGDENELELHASRLVGRGLTIKEAKAYVEQMLRHHQKLPFKRLWKGTQS